MSDINQFLDHSTLAFQGKRFEVRSCEIISSKNEKHRFDAVVHPGAVVILPLLDDDSIVMIRNKRLAVGTVLLELPAGTLEPNEPPLKTAHRELIEETGYRAALIDSLIQFYTSPGICNEMMHAYVAKGLHFVGQHLDDTESITTEIVSRDKIMSMIRNGEIIDGKTIATLLFYVANEFLPVIY